MKAARTDAGTKRERVQGMFSQIAPGYDRLNGVLSLSLHRQWRRNSVTLLRLKPGQAAVDVCSGTGDFLAELRAAVGASGALAGIDFAAPMLAVSVTKGHPEVAVGDACALPVRSGVAYGATCGWGLRNVVDLDAALAEVFRVLRPGGRFVALDTMVPTNPVMRVGSRVVFGLGSRLLGVVTGQREAYAYLPESTQIFATPPELVAALGRAGFVDAAWDGLMFGNVVRLVARKPE